VPLHLSHKVALAQFVQSVILQLVSYKILLLLLAVVLVVVFVVLVSVTGGGVA